VLRFELQEFAVPTKKGTSVALRLKSGLAIARAPSQQTLITILEQNLGEMPRADLREEALRRGMKGTSFPKIVANAKASGRITEDDGIISLVVGNNDSAESVEDDRKDDDNAK
jgi:hypothetical protein